jgi:PASTA domain
MPLTTLVWLVIAVVLVAGLGLIWAFRVRRPAISRGTINRPSMGAFSNAIRDPTLSPKGGASRMAEFVGRVAQFQQSTQDSGYGEGKETLQVWDFEVQHLNDAGDVDRAVPVHMVGRAFDGRIRNDEQVRIDLPASWREGTSAQVDRIFSETRNVWVAASGKRSGGGLCLIPFVIFFLLVVAGIVFIGFQVVPHLNLPIGNATVPNVIGEDSSQALTELSNAGFEWSTDNESSSTVPFGHVISTDPQPGATASKGSIVKVVISTGPNGP